MSSTLAQVGRRVCVSINIYIYISFHTHFILALILCLDPVGEVHFVCTQQQSSKGAQSSCPLFLFWFSLIHSERLFWLSFPLHALPTLSCAVSVCLCSEVPPALSRKGAGVSALINQLVFVQCKASHCSQLPCWFWLQSVLLFSSFNPSLGSWTTASLPMSAPRQTGTLDLTRGLQRASLVFNLLIAALSLEGKGTCVE